MFDKILSRFRKQSEPPQPVRIEVPPVNVSAELDDGRLVNAVASVVQAVDGQSDPQLALLLKMSLSAYLGSYYNKLQPDLAQFFREQADSYLGSVKELGE